jgi:hypothetical protein
METLQPTLELMQVITFNSLYVEYCWMMTVEPYAMFKSETICLN